MYLIGPYKAKFSKLEHSGITMCKSGIRKYFVESTSLNDAPVANRNIHEKFLKISVVT